MTSVRKQGTIKRIQEELGFDLKKLFPPWPAPLELHELGLNTLATIEELLRIFSRYQRLDERQIRRRLAEAVPRGKKPTFGPLNKLLRRLQAAPDSSQHLPSPRSSSERSSSERSSSERSSSGEEEFQEREKESSVELGRGISEGINDEFNHSSDNLNLDDDDLPAEDSPEPSRNQLEDDTDFLLDRHDSEQTDLPSDEDHPLFDDPLELGSKQVEGESNSSPLNQHHKLSEKQTTLPRDNNSSPLRESQNESPLPSRSDFPLGKAKNTELRMANAIAQRRGKATHPKDTASEKSRTSGPPEEDKTRAGLQAALTDAKSKHYDAEKEVERWQESCIKICGVVDRAERKIATGRGSRLEPQDLLQNSDPEVLRRKAKAASTIQQKRAKQQDLLTRVISRQEQRVEALLRARQRSTQTHAIIERIEALLEDLSGLIGSSDAVVEESDNADDDVDSLLEGLDDEDLL